MTGKLDTTVGPQPCSRPGLARRDLPHRHGGSTGTPAPSGTRYHTHLQYPRPHCQGPSCSSLRTQRGLAQEVKGAALISLPSLRTMTERFRRGFDNIFEKGEEDEGCCCRKTVAFLGLPLNPPFTRPLPLPFDCKVFLAATSCGDFQKVRNIFPKLARTSDTCLPTSRSTPIALLTSSQGLASDKVHHAPSGVFNLTVSKGPERLTHHELRRARSQSQARSPQPWQDALLHLCQSPDKVVQQEAPLTVTFNVCLGPRLSSPSKSSLDLAGLFHQVKLQPIIGCRQNSQAWFCRRAKGSEEYLEQMVSSPSLVMMGLCLIEQGQALAAIFSRLLDYLRSIGPPQVPGCERRRTTEFLTRYTGPFLEAVPC